MQGWGLKDSGFNWGHVRGVGFSRGEGSGPQGLGYGGEVQIEGFKFRLGHVS